MDTHWPDGMLLHGPDAQGLRFSVEIKSGLPSWDRGASEALDRRILIRIECHRLLLLEWLRWTDWQAAPRGAVNLRPRAFCEAPCFMRVFGE